MFSQCEEIECSLLPYTNKRIRQRIKFGLGSARHCSDSSFPLCWGTRDRFTKRLCVVKDDSRDFGWNAPKERSGYSNLGAARILTQQLRNYGFAARKPKILGPSWFWDCGKAQVLRGPNVLGVWEPKTLVPLMVLNILACESAERSPCFEGLGAQNSVTSQ